MIGRWKVFRNPDVGYIVGRVRDTTKPMHSGNVEYYGEYGEDKAEKKAIADELNKAEKQANEKGV